MRSPCAVLFVCLGALAGSADAATDRHAVATRRTLDVTVDGHIDEAAWKAAPAQSDF